MSVMKKNRWAITLAACLIACFVVLEEVAVKRAQALPNQDYQELETFANVLSIVQKNYVEPVSTKRLVDGAITGMLASLDPHSAYLTPELYRDLEVETRGSFGGLGIEITIKNGVLTIVSPIEDTPAYKAGLKAGDQIIKINDDFTKDMTLTDAVKRMRGPRGSTDPADDASHRSARAVQRHRSLATSSRFSRSRPKPSRTATATCASAPFRRAPTTASKRRSTNFQKANHGQDQRPGARPARQSRRSAQSGGESLRRVPRRRA